MSIFNFSLIFGKSQWPCGFLLLDVCISIMLAASMSIGISLWYTHMIQNYSEVRQRLEALTVASSLLEYVRASGKIPTDHTIVNDPGYSIEWHKEPYGEVDNFWLVRVRVIWKKNNQVRSVDLTTGAVMG
jgi:Tfp pilus assembly protein PilV